MEGKKPGINLKEMFGDKYRVEFDKESFQADWQALKCGRCRKEKYKDRKRAKQAYKDRDDGDKDGCAGICKVSVSPEWYYSIKCKYGNISLSGGNELVLYCASRKVSNRINNEMGGKIKKIVQGEKDSLIYFDVRHIEEIFQYVHPKTKRKLSAEHLNKLQAGRQNYLSQKREEPV